MARGWQLAYLVGATPWEKPGAQGGAEEITRLVSPAENGGPPHGAALDVGCGSGMHSVLLARRGWTVTGVDIVERALRRARRRSQDAGVDINFVRADAADLPSVVKPGLRLVLDVGCYHVLGDRTRAGYVAGLNQLAEPGALLVMLAFPAGGRGTGPRPRGISTEQAVADLRGWGFGGEVGATAQLPAIAQRWGAPRWLTFTRLAGPAPAN